MKSPQNGNHSGPFVEIFTGSGNGPEDARENADTRYQTWRVLERREGRQIKEISTEYVYKHPNSVHCRCTLKVVYSI
jgi:hypothetical protein